MMWRSPSRTATTQGSPPSSSPVGAAFLRPLTSTTLHLPFAPSFPLLSFSPALVALLVTCPATPLPSPSLALGLPPPRPRRTDSTPPPPGAWTAETSPDSSTPLQEAPHRSETAEGSPSLRSSIVSQHREGSGQRALTTDELTHFAARLVAFSPPYDCLHSLPPNPVLSLSTLLDSEVHSAIAFAALISTTWPLDRCRPCDPKPRIQVRLGVVLWR